MSKKGYTLLELLLVICIIFILSGLIIAVMDYTNQKIGKGRAIKDLERLKSAIEEYYLTFGVFPPVNQVSWEHTNSILRANVLNTYERKGLTYYLFGEEIVERGRWTHFIQGMDTDGAILHSNNVMGFGLVIWTNATKTILDPWERDYRYIGSIPEYQGYFLWSVGKDGKDGTSDDIGSAWQE